MARKSSRFLTATCFVQQHTTYEVLGGFTRPAEEGGLWLSGLFSVVYHAMDFFPLDHMSVPAGHKAVY